MVKKLAESVLSSTNTNFQHDSTELLFILLWCRGSLPPLLPKARHIGRVGFSLLATQLFYCLLRVAQKALYNIKK